MMQRSVDIKIDDLPEELLLHILSQLGILDLHHTSAANKLLRRIASTNQLWKRITALTSPHYYNQIKNKEEDIDWRTKCLMDIKLHFRRSNLYFYTKINTLDIASLNRIAFEDLHIKINNERLIDVILSRSPSQDILNRLYQIRMNTMIDTFRINKDIPFSRLYWAIKLNQLTYVREVLRNLKLNAFKTIETYSIFESYSHPPSFIPPDKDEAWASGNTPLLTAALYGRAEMVDLLITSGASVDDCLFTGRTAVFLAAEHGNNEVLRILLKKSNHLIDKRSNAGITPLMVAAENTNSETVKILLEGGANVNKQAFRGVTALMFAAYKGHLANLKLLLKYNAQTEIIGYVDHTALSLAAMFGHMQCVAALVSHGANQYNGNNAAALLAVSQCGNIDILKYLLNLHDNNVTMSMTTQNSPEIFRNIAKKCDASESMDMFILEHEKLYPDLNYIEINAFELSIILKQHDIAKALYKEFKNINALTRHTQVLAAMALKSNDLSTIRILTAYGVNFIVPTATGLIPQELSAGHTKINSIIEGANSHHKNVDEYINNIRLFKPINEQKDITQQSIRNYILE